MKLQESIYFILDKLKKSGIDKLSIDENGYLKISDMYFNTPNEAGYILDQYGNFIHSKNEPYDTWNIMSYDNTSHLKVNFETGKIFTDDALATTDSTGYEYPLIWDNGVNLWIGSTMTAAQHHKGMTFISSGHNGTNGNGTIYVSVPNAANDNATNYAIWHEGNFPKPNVTVRRLDQSGDMTQTGTSFKTLSGAFSYTTKTGRFMVIATVPLKTSRFTSNSAIMVNGTAKGIAGTNSQTMITTNPMTVETFEPNTTVTIGIGIKSQDSGTTATVPGYNSPLISVFDLPI